MLGAELPDEVVHRTKMLKRMQVLEEKGPAFATRPLSSLPVIGTPLGLKESISVECRDWLMSAVVHWVLIWRLQEAGSVHPLMFLQCGASLKSVLDALKLVSEVCMCR